MAWPSISCNNVTSYIYQNSERYNVLTLHPNRKHTHTHTHIYIYIYIYTSVYVCWSILVQMTYIFSFLELHKRDFLSQKCGSVIGQNDNGYPTMRAIFGKRIILKQLWSSRSADVISPNFYAVFWKSSTWIWALKMLCRQFHGENISTRLSEHRQQNCSRV